MTETPAATGYTGTAKSLHWLIVALLIVQFIVGWTMPAIHRDTQPETLINLHFSRKPIRTPADTHPSDPATDKALGDLHKLLHLELIDRGYYMARRGFIALSLPTTEKDTDGFVAALADILETHGALIERSLPAGL